MKSKITFEIITAIIFITILTVNFFVLDHLSLNYRIYSQGLLISNKEWILPQSSDGNFICTIKDYKTGTNASYNVTEFSRGDVVNFKLYGDLEQIGYIKKK